MHATCALYIFTLNVVDTSTQFVYDTFTAASQYLVDGSPNVARLQGCHITPGSILCALCICNTYMHSLCAICMCTMSAYCNVAKMHRSSAPIATYANLCVLCRLICTVTVIRLLPAYCNVADAHYSPTAFTRSANPCVLCSRCL